MKKLLLLTFAAFLAAFPSADAKKLKAMLSYTVFNAPGSGPYLETYLSVMGHSVVFAKNSNGKYQGAIEVAVTFKNKEGIKFADKYNLLSQEVTDTNDIDFNFLDQERVALAEDEYTFDISISDKNSTDPPFKSTQVITIGFPKDKINISGIQMLESINKSAQPGRLTKNGFDLVPYVSNYYPPANNTLKFYAEIYNTKEILSGSMFLVSYYLEDYETRITLDKFRVFNKQQPQEVNVVMSEFNITELPSGNYNLVIEVRNNKNELLAMQQSFFQRSSNIVAEAKAEDLLAINISNTFAAALTDSMKLREMIHSFRPVSNASENNFEDFQLKNADLLTMQRYTYRFWKIRNPENPEAAFQDYMSKVELVNNLYKTPIDMGYETDRGRVFLQYGEPNEIVKEDREPSSYPYEIWHYYKIKSQTNRKFIFYNTDLVTNDFKLLHSDMPGEVNEPQWQVILHKRNTQIRDYETKKTRERNFGENSGSNFGERKDE